MIVLYEKVLPSDGWLVVGKRYAVVSVFGDPRRLLYRIRSEMNAIPALFPADHFSISNGAIPSNWTFSLLADGAWCLSPNEFAAPGFWEAFFDDDPLAMATFAAVADRLA